MKVELDEVYIASKDREKWWCKDAAVEITTYQQMQFNHNPIFVKFVSLDNYTLSRVRYSNSLCID